MIDLRKGNCLEVMKTIKDNSIDAIITDPPYGTTACKWDSVIDFDLMWEQLNRIIKPNGAIVLFGSEPFSSALRMSNIKNYKYDWIWSKSNPANINCGNFQPMKYHEIISVFYSKKGTFNKQMIERSKAGIKTIKNVKKNKTSFKPTFKDLNSKAGKTEYSSERYNTKLKNPSSLIFFNSVRPKSKEKVGHPTQKPLELMEYLIKTYTNEGDTILDFTMGSGSTMVAAQNLNRNGIGIEQDEKYFKIAEQRIKENEFKLF